MAEALKQDSGCFFPGVSSGKGDRSPESGNAGYAYSMPVETVDPDISVEDHATLRTGDSPDGVDSIDVKNRKTVVVQMHKGAGDSSLSGNVLNSNGENSSGRGPGTQKPVLYELLKAHLPAIFQSSCDGSQAALHQLIKVRDKPEDCLEPLCTDLSRFFEQLVADPAAVFKQLSEGPEAVFKQLSAKLPAIFKLTSDGRPAILELLRAGLPTVFNQESDDPSVILKGLSADLPTVFKQRSADPTVISKQLSTDPAAIIEDFKTDFTNNLTISLNRKKIETLKDEIKKLQGVVGGELDVFYSENPKECRKAIGEVLEGMKAESSKHSKAIKELKNDVEALGKISLEELKVLVEKYSEDEELSLINEQVCETFGLEKKTQCLMPLLDFLNFLENGQEITSANDEFRKSGSVKVDSDCSGKELSINDEMVNLLNIKKQWSDLCLLSQIYSKTKKWVGQIQHVLDNKESIQEAAKLIGEKSDEGVGGESREVRLSENATTNSDHGTGRRPDSGPDFGLSDFIAKISERFGVPEVRESSNVKAKPEVYFKLLCTDLLALSEKLKLDPQTNFKLLISEPEAVFKQLSAKMPTLFKLLRREKTAVQKLLRAGLPTVFECLRTEPGEFFNLLRTDLPTAFAQLPADLATIPESSSVELVAIFKSFKADLDSNVASSEKKDRKIKSLKFEIKKLQRSLESELGELVPCSENSPLDLEECYKKIASGCEKMEAEYKAHQKMMDGLIVVAKKLGDIKPERLKLFVEELKSLKRFSGEVYKEGDELPVCDKGIAECPPPERNKQYMILVGQFLNFLDACPPMFKKLTSINNYFRKNSLEENDDNSSVKVDGLDNEEVCLLSRKDWLSVICPLSQEFSKLKKWEGQAKYYLENKEAVKGIVRWVSNQSDDDVAVSLAGHVQGEKIEILNKEKLATESDLKKMAGKRLKKMEKKSLKSDKCFSLVNRNEVGINFHGVDASNKIGAGFKYSGSLEIMRGNYKKSSSGFAKKIQGFNERLEKGFGDDAELRKKREKAIHLVGTHLKTTELKCTKDRESFKELGAFLTFMDSSLPDLCKGFTERFTGSVPKQLLDLISTDHSSVKAADEMVLRAESLDKSERPIPQAGIKCVPGFSSSTDNEIEENAGSKVDLQKTNKHVRSDSESEQLVFSDHFDLIESVGDVKDLVSDFLGGDEQLERKFKSDYAGQQDRHQLVVNEFLQLSELKQLLENEKKGVQIKKALRNFSRKWDRRFRPAFEPAFRFVGKRDGKALERMNATVLDKIKSNTDKVDPGFGDSARSSYSISSKKADGVLKK